MEAQISKSESEKPFEEVESSIAKEITGSENHLQPMPSLDLNNMFLAPSKASNSGIKSLQTTMTEKKHTLSNRFDDAERPHSRKKKGKEQLLLADVKSARQERKTSCSQRRPYKKDRHFLSSNLGPNQPSEGRPSMRK